MSHVLLSTPCGTSTSLTTHLKVAICNQLQRIWSEMCNLKDAWTTWQPACCSNIQGDLTFALVGRAQLVTALLGLTVHRLFRELRTCWFHQQHSRGCGITLRNVLYIIMFNKKGGRITSFWNFKQLTLSSVWDNVSVKSKVPRLIAWV